METRHNLRKIALLAGAALLTSGALAVPIEEQTTRTEIVKYNQPESTTPDGARKLYRKLQAAALRVCSVDDPPKGYVPDSSCVVSALSKAVADIGSPQVSAVHLQKQPASKLASAKQRSPSELDTVASR